MLRPSSCRGDLTPILGYCPDLGKVISLLSGIGCLVLNSIRLFDYRHKVQLSIRRALVCCIIIHNEWERLVQQLRRTGGALGQIDVSSCDAREQQRCFQRLIAEVTRTTVFSPSLVETGGSLGISATDGSLSFSVPCDNTIEKGWGFRVSYNLVGRPRTSV